MYRIAFVILILFSSCDGKPDIHRIPEAPADLLDQDKFTEILVDAELLEATLKLKLIRKKDINRRIPGFYDQIFEKHSISEEQFRSNFEFYSAQAQKLMEIYDSVEVRLVRRKTDLETRSKKLNLKPDTTENKKIIQP